MDSVVEKEVAASLTGSTEEKKPYITPSIEEEDAYITYSLSCTQRQTGRCMWPQNS